MNKPFVSIKTAFDESYVTVNVEDVRRVLATYDAKVRYLQSLDDAGHIYRIQSDGTTHYVNDVGVWTPLGYSWPNGIDCYYTPITEADAERQIVERTPKSVTTPPTFTPGDFLMDTKFGWGVVRVIERLSKMDMFAGEYRVADIRNEKRIGIMDASDLRLATPDEVYVATHIILKPGMLLEDTTTGVVVVVTSVFAEGHGGFVRDVTKLWENSGALRDLLVCDYIVRDSVTVSGVY